MIRYLIVLGALTICSLPLAKAENVAPYARFDKWLGKVEVATFTSKDPKKVARKMVTGGTRVAAFNLQALTKLYKNFDKDSEPLFEPYYKGFKKLEDLIGDYDKWEKAHARAMKSRRSQAKIDELKGNMEAALTKLEGFLEEKEWVTESRADAFPVKFRRFLRDYHWPSYAKEKSRFAELLAKDLKEILSTKYDLATLEQGDGLHELRRDLRWHIIKSRVLGGLIGFAEGDACPLKDYAYLAKKTPDSFSSLPEDEEEEISPCLVSKCLFLAVNELQVLLGAIKDKAEGAELTGDAHNDRVPETLQGEAEALWQTAEKRGLLPATIRELEACQR